MNRDDVLSGLHAEVPRYRPEAVRHGRNHGDSAGVSVHEPRKQILHGFHAGKEVPGLDLPRTNLPLDPGDAGIYDRIGEGSHIGAVEIVNALLDGKSVLLTDEGHGIQWLGPEGTTPKHGMFVKSDR